MANGNDIVAQAADGTQHVFPAGTDVSIIDSAMKRYAAPRQTGAMQAKPGGPVFNAKAAAGPGAEPSMAGTAAREAALGATSVILPEKAASTSGRQNISTIISGLNEQVNRAATTPWAQGGPIYGTLAMIGNSFLNALHGVASGGEEMVGSFGRPTTERGIVSSEQFAHGAGTSLGNLATLGLLRKTPEALADPFARESIKNLSNVGEEKAAFLQRQVGKGNAVQQHVKGALDAVYADGQQLMKGVSDHIDRAEPNGAFDRADVHNVVKDAMGVVKADQRVPAEITKLLSEGKATKGPTIGGKTLDLTNPADLAAYQRYKASGAFTPEEAARYEGSATGKMSFEELKQHRSELGRQIDSSEGPVDAGAKTAYAKLSEMLRNKAESHGLLNEWTQGVSKIKGFSDAVYRSPLKSTYFGENHGEIMKPFVSDDTAPQVNNILSKYTPYGIDLDKLQDTVGSYKYGEMWDRMSNPSKRMAIVAAISPKVAGGMILAPRAMRSAAATKYQFPNQLEEVPTIAPGKVYPSQKVAAAAAKKKP